MKYRFLYIILIISLATSCERVIDIDLNEANPKIVIEASLHNGVETNLIKISKTGNFFGSDTLKMVSGAKITLSDDFTTNTFDEIEEGIYGLFKIGKLFPTTYTLTVEVEEETYQAVSTMPSSVPLSYLGSEFREKTLFQDEGYLVNFAFKDPTGEDNYYRVRHYLNGQLQNDPEDFFLRKDDLFDGNVVQMQLNNRFIKNDTVMIELMSIDKATYEYYNTLRDVMISGSAESAAPANPKGNFSNGALGYFSAYSFDRKTIVVK